MQRGNNEGKKKTGKHKYKARKIREYWDLRLVWFIFYSLPDPKRYLCAIQGPIAQASI
jgi:hypothetical protein